MSKPTRLSSPSPAADPVPEDAGSPAGGDATPVTPGAASFIRSMRRVLSVTTLGLAVVLPLATGLGWALGGSTVGFGILLGLAIPAAFFGMTVLTGVFAAKLDNGPFIGVVMAGWFVKMVVLIIIMAAIRDADFFHRTAFFVALVVGVAGWLGAEILIVLRSRIAYVELPPRSVSPSATGASTSGPGTDPRGE